MPSRTFKSGSALSRAGSVGSTVMANEHSSISTNISYRHDLKQFVVRGGSAFLLCIRMADNFN
jgi:hypothetical protein